ncbi:sodium-dependent neutral amino acid transporter B(0)AT3 isoform X2 [Neocloeon triangulifer]|uniref:sodium-dependent neutral amino acid transporter B(0)AT3 isoform X2 n=1 Tax=Neocloeon triangulifer TaxID=2078957 RepID=UPI00286F9443|nr:sodium-dependent neutral amino acid transporter B(0)AT3 isoform X2 [Neocloeon triangulifer]
MVNKDGGSAHMGRTNNSLQVPNGNNGTQHHEFNSMNIDSDGSGVGVTIVLPEKQERAAWDNKLQFFLSIIGYSVGLGNIWRFPYLCQQNGGGAFLIPFFIMLILEGIPLFLVEIGIGQKQRLGALGVWNIVHPWLGGLGIASCVVTFFVALYYNVIITWCFYYLFNSFQYPLPWAECPLTANGTKVEECELSSETAYFWYRQTLDVSPSMDDSGGLKWWIVLCLLLAWTVVFFIVMKGIQSSGKVVYFTSLFPYVVLTIFFIRGITLKGAAAGLIHMYTPKIEKLLNPTVWLDAATQVFYSFGLAFGSLIAFGSYNQQNNNCVRDVVFVSITNAVTAIYASVVIFSILGFKAMANVDRCIEHNMERMFEHHLISAPNVSTEVYEQVMSTLNETVLHTWKMHECSLERELDQAAEGTGLAFIVFTQAIVELPGAPFWAIIFFLMLLSLGLGSQIGILEGMLCTIFDIDFFRERIPKQYLTAGVCIICFFVGLIFCTGAGEYWLSLFDSFAGTIGLVVIALLEMIAVMYIYGHEKFTKDIYDMTGYRPGLYWQITWRYLGPIIMTCILTASILHKIMHRPTYSAWDATTGTTVSTVYPDWVMVIAICIIAVGVLPIPAVFLLRRFQCLKLDTDIHQGAIRRIDTTASTREMMADVDMDEYHDYPNSQEVDDSPDDHLRPPRRIFKMEVLDD